MRKSLLIILFVAFVSCEFTMFKKHPHISALNHKTPLPYTLQTATRAADERQMAKAIPRSVDSTQDGVFGLILGLVYGLQYSQQSMGQCYSRVDISLSIIENLLRNFILAFLPWNWGKILLDVNDLTVIGANVYNDCEIQQIAKFFENLVSGEGVSELGSRVLGGAIFELPKLLDKLLVSLSEGTRFDLGMYVGKLGQIVLGISLP